MTAPVKYRLRDDKYSLKRKLVAKKGDIVEEVKVYDTVVIVQLANGERIPLRLDEVVKVILK